MSRNAIDTLSLKNHGSFQGDITTAGTSLDTFLPDY
jgi:hypothetical protein